jgi:hypothetical protein
MFPFFILKFLLLFNFSFLHLCTMNSLVVPAVMSEGFDNSNPIKSRSLGERQTDHKCIYWLITMQGLWYCDTDLNVAKHRAGKLMSGKKVLIGHRIVQAVFAPETTDEELKELGKCWFVNDWGCMGACSDRTPEDWELIENRLVAFLTTDYHKTMPKPKK